MTDKSKDRIIELIEKPLLEEGAELAGVALSRYKLSTTLRLFVYSERSVSVDECSRLSRLVGGLIDGTDLLSSGYTLEVSSPGLDRPLTTARDFKFRVGETVRLEFVDKGRKNLTAEIVAATDEQIELKNESGLISFGLAEIKQAKIVF